MSYQYVYVMKSLSKTYPGGKEVLKDIWLSFYPGAKIGIIGTNGTGKSTLLRIMAGLDQDFGGEAWAAEGATVGYLPQEPHLDEDLTVEENIMAGLGTVKEALDEFNVISTKFMEPMSDEEMNELLARQGELQETIDALDGWNLERSINIAMDALRCPPGDSSVKHLSGGERRRVALCKLLLQKPDLLLLDEPTNHLDAESVAWLDRHLQEYKGTVVLVTHDRYFLDNVVSWILELDRGQGFPFEGNYSAWLEAKEKRLIQEQKTDDSRKKQISSELEWIRSNPKGRHAKSKARLEAYDRLVSEASRRKYETSQISIPTGKRLGDTVIEANGLRKSFDDKLLFEDVSFKLPPGGIVGVIGPNGAGKSTLFKIIAGAAEPDEGAIVRGDTVEISYVDQSRETLSDQKTVWEDVSDGQDMIDLGGREVPSRAYCSWFSFKGPDQQKKVGMLSGGERNRLHLAKTLKKGGNLLMLDEPTNDLDVDTLRALEEALLNFPGCAVVISHDRFFLDRIATHILAFEGDSKVVWFEGNYADYEEDLKRRMGNSYQGPKRIKYKPLTR